MKYQTIRHMLISMLYLLPGNKITYYADELC